MRRANIKQQRHLVKSADVICFHFQNTLGRKFYLKQRNWMAGGSRRASTNHMQQRNWTAATARQPITVRPPLNVRHKWEH